MVASGWDRNDRLPEKTGSARLPLAPPGLSAHTSHALTTVTPTYPGQSRVLPLDLLHFDCDTDHEETSLWLHTSLNTPWGVWLQANDRHPTFMQLHGNPRAWTKRLSPNRPHSAIENPKTYIWVYSRHGVLLIENRIVPGGPDRSHILRYGDQARLQKGRY
jgi:hypothetical protein